MTDTEKRKGFSIMNKTHAYSLGVGLAMLGAGFLYAGDATEPYSGSHVDARLNVEVSKDTDVVHFVRANNDPDVITKTYVLKHADPYEIRSYLRQIVQTRRVDDSDTGIQAVKYNDGTGVVMVSAEDYRFEDSENGQGIDSIIETLDKPNVFSASGRTTWLYQPKFRSAAELKKMVRIAGAAMAGDATENIGGGDRVESDPYLNVVFFNASPFSKANIDRLLKQYDCPYPEVNAKVTVYEIYAENDAKLGLDFQAWKNNDGIDLFNAGGRFMQNYVSGTEMVRDAKWSSTKYLNFNPKWSTRYIDFLTSRGKAKVLHRCELNVRNNTTAGIARTTQVFLASAEPIEDDAIKDKNGNKVGSDKVQVGGVDVKIGGVDVLQIGGEEVDGDPAVPLMKGNQITTEASDEFGFYMTITPSIAADATMLDVSISNSSLIGYTTKGEPRIQKGAGVASTFMISNKGTKLVIGGIEKRDVVSVSNGLPFLKDLPFVGWIFSTESESTKRSQLLVVAEILPVRPAGEEEIQSIDKALSKSGESNSFGYRQFILDENR